MRVRLSTLLPIAIPILALVAAAYVQWLTVGRSEVPVYPAVPPVTTAEQPFGFPAWICWTHYVNFLFLTLLIRSGLQILMELRASTRRPERAWRCGPFRPSRAEGRGPAGAEGRAGR